MYRYICPHCGNAVTVQKRVELPTRPFCCLRCQQVDLGKWLSGAYWVSDPLPNPGDLLDSSPADEEPAG